MEYVDRFLALIDSLPGFFVYISLFFGAFLENIFPPAPGDTITAFGAFLVGTKKLYFLPMFVSTTMGSICGFMFLFWIGGFVGRRFFIKRDYRFFKAKDIIRAEAWFRKYGYFLILVNRFFPGIRSVISIVAGITRLRPFKVFMLCLVSGTAWNLLWVSMGYTLGSNWELARHRIDTIMAGYTYSILGSFGIILLFFLARKLIRRT